MNPGNLRFKNKSGNHQLFLEHVLFKAVDDSKNNETIIVIKS